MTLLTQRDTRKLMVFIRSIRCSYQYHNILSTFPCKPAFLGQCTWLCYLLFSIPSPFFFFLLHVLGHRFFCTNYNGLYRKVHNRWLFVWSLIESSSPTYLSTFLWIISQAQCCVTHFEYVKIQKERKRNNSFQATSLEY